MNTRLRIVPFTLITIVLLSAFASQFNAQRGGQAQPAPQSIEMTDGPTIINGVDVSRLQFRYVGPPGNRVSAVVSPPGLVISKLAIAMSCGTASS